MSGYMSEWDRQWWFEHFQERAVSNARIAPYRPLLDRAAKMIVDAYEAGQPAPTEIVLTPREFDMTLRFGELPENKGEVSVFLHAGRQIEVRLLRMLVKVEGPTP